MASLLSIWHGISFSSLYNLGMEKPLLAVVFALNIWGQIIEVTEVLKANRIEPLKAKQNGMVCKLGPYKPI